MWYSSLKCVMDKIEIYINLQFSNNIDVWEIGGMIRELILNRPYENHILNYEERKMMIDYTGMHVKNYKRSVSQSLWNLGH